ncbi:hypothetical protein [Paraburkholderia susongensis]|uniref:Uncharacterized protein n=1 Tax=Paraburkholderia susongensis TaxID=1515439 RepID=A0A1X7LM73_9BURK|nr:hypothetical protein [Paraburkholderia susongensis]SMG54968.1 hypothetical protein SAMN06265784_10763 [Paraburkholderia susongensis]
MRSDSQHDMAAAPAESGLGSRRAAGRGCPSLAVRSLLLYLAALLGFLLVPAAWADAHKSQNDWVRFRATYPLNMQVIALSEPGGDGHRTLVISEPPPDVTLEDLKQISPLLSAISLQKSRIGYNGVLIDAVVDLPPASQAQVDSLVAMLSTRLYGTSYKAYALPIADTPPPSRLSGLDVTLTSKQIWKWFIGDNRERRAGTWTLQNGTIALLTILIGAVLVYQAIRRRRFILTLILLGVGVSIVLNAAPDSEIPPSAGVLRLQSLQGGPAMTLQQILDRGARGVYASTERGFIVWCIAANKDLASSRAEAREFALDTDLVLGGVGAANGYVVIIGRERINRVDTLPPLRVETVMLLASADRDELSQSYERTFAFAGRIDDTRKLDWAPIYLSDQLIDTEYGSLLNVTDQMLKSWSMGGKVHYVNFRYPDPPSFSPSSPLLTKETIEGGSVTFNWNTKGAGYAVQQGDFDVYALHRTGALPIDYLAGDNSNVRAAEDASYDWFGTLGDANLARVVQYAALYQLFVHFDIHAAAEPVRAAPRFDGAHETTAQVLDNFLSAGLSAPDLEAAHPELTKMLDDARKAQSELRAYLDTATDAQREALIDAIADPVAFRVATAKSDAQTHAMLKVVVHVADALQNLSRDNSVRIAVAKSYVEQWNKRPTSGWIRTPSVVISSASVPGADVQGGHNLSSAILDYQADSSVARGTVKVVDQNGHPVVLYNHADADGLPAVERIVGRDAGSRDPALIEQDVQSAFRQAKLDMRNVSETLHLPADIAQGAGRGMGGGGIPPGGYRSGWRFAPEPGGGSDGQLLAAFATTQKDHGLSVPLIITRDANMQFSVHGPDGLFVEATNPPAAVDALRQLAAQHSDAVVHLHFHNMDERSARSLLNSVKLQDSSQDVRLIATSDGTMEPQALKAVLDARYDWAKAAESVRVSEPIQAGDRIAIDLEMKVDAIGSGPSLLVRIRLFFDTLSDALKVKLADIQAMLHNIQSPDVALASIKLRHDLHVAYGSFDDTSFQFVDKQNKDFYVVSRPSPDTSDENDRLA